MPYRLDRNRNSAGVITYVREDIMSNVLKKHLFPNVIEGTLVKTNFKKSKWLLRGTYHPLSEPDQLCFDNTEKAPHVYC